MNTEEWLTQLIAFDTTSANTNLPLIACVESWLRDQHIHSHLTYDASKTKANLFATLPAKNGTITGGLVLSGHTDVVPVTGQDWKTDPFVATKMNDTMVGRGACDMKGFLAVVLASVPKLKSLRLPKPVHFALSFDEEVGCLGAPLLINDLKQLNICPAGCIVGEPTEMRAVLSHKGINLVRCLITGKAAHSSLTHLGCNAIEHSGQFIQYLRSVSDGWRNQGPFDSHFDVPYTTLSTNQIKGGIATNIIPEACELLFEFRQLPDMSAKTILSDIEAHAKKMLMAMQEDSQEANIVLQALGSVPSFAADGKATLTRLVRELTGTKEELKVSYATEAGLFQAANIPTIVCGPGSIREAHRANEYVTLPQLRLCEEFLQRIVMQF